MITEVVKEGPAGAGAGAGSAAAAAAVRPRFSILALLAFLASIGLFGGTLLCAGITIARAQGWEPLDWLLSLDTGWVYGFRELEYREAMIGGIGLLVAAVLGFVGVVALDIVAIAAAKAPARKGRSLAVIGLCLSGLFVLALPGAVQALRKPVGVWRDLHGQVRYEPARATSVAGELLDDRADGQGNILNALVAVKVLGEVGDPSAVDRLAMAAVKHPSPTVRAAALAELTELAHRRRAAAPRAAETAVRCLADPEEAVARLARRVLGNELGNFWSGAYDAVIQSADEAEAGRIREIMDGIRAEESSRRSGPRFFPQ